LVAKTARIALGLALIVALLTAAAFALQGWYANKPVAFADLLLEAWPVFLFAFLVGAMVGLLSVGYVRHTLSHPLRRLAHALASVDPAAGKITPLSIAWRQPNDEIGAVVLAGNLLLAGVNELLVQCAHADEELRDSERQLNNIIDSVPMLVFARDTSGQFLFANRASRSLLQMEAGQKEPPGTALDHPLLAGEAQVLNEAEQARVDEITVTDGDTVRTLAVNKLRFDSFGKTAVLTIAMDVTERDRAHGQIAYLAFHDTLTGLANRNRLQRRLSNSLARCKSSGHSGALLLIDLDGFKRINETFGHQLGDELLRQSGRRIRAAFRNDDLVARVGPNRFAVLAVSLSRSALEAREVARRLASLVHDLFNEPLECGEKEFEIPVSIGFSLFPDDSADADEILRFADTALFQAKQAGGNVVMPFEPAMAAAVTRRTRLEHELREAMKLHQLQMYLQPQFDISGQVLTGAEVLLRWRHPTRGLVPAAEFIPVLEATGLIVPATHELLLRTCRQLATWFNRGWWGTHQHLSINISARHLKQNDFVEELEDILRLSGTPPGCVHLEITEGTMLGDIERVIDTMTAVRSMGVGFALDDFGTGFSSLSYLKRLPVDVLKVDQSFVRGLPGNEHDCTLVRIILDLADGLGLQVIAEGVENNAQLDFLAACASPMIQGYLFGKPMPVAEFEELLRAGSASRNVVS